MAAKACRNCKRIIEGNFCKNCNLNDLVDSFKGKIVVLNPEKSEIANNLKFKEKGNFALRLS